MTDPPSPPHSRGSSHLSSLSPSPEPESRPAKRQRLSVSPSLPKPDQPIFLVQHRSPSPRQLQEEQQEEEEDEQQGRQEEEDLNKLLEGLEEEDFDLPPSSAPCISSVPPQDDQDDADEEMEGAKGAADDSGIGLIPFESEDKLAQQEVIIEPPYRVETVEPGDEEEFEGDDMWLGFDEGDVMGTLGFDQIDAFPSSITSSSVVPPPPVGKGSASTKDSGTDEKDKKEEEEAEGEFKEKPPPIDLASFGFSTVQSGSGGLFFASRKSFAPSADALKQALARYGDDPFEGEGVTSEPSIAITNPKPSSFSTGFSTGFSNAAGRSIAAPSEEALQRARKQFEKSSSPDRPLPSTTKSKSKSSRPPSNVPSRVPSRTGNKPPPTPTTSDLFESTTSGIENQGPRSYYSLQPLALAPEAEEEESSNLGSKNRSNLFDSPTITRTRSFHQPPSEDLESSNGRRSPLKTVENEVSVAALEEDDNESTRSSTETTLTSSSPHKRPTSPTCSLQPAANPECRPPPRSPASASAASISSKDSPRVFPQVSTNPPPPLPLPAPVATRPSSAYRDPTKSTTTTMTTSNRPTPVASNRFSTAFRSPMIQSARHSHTSIAPSSTPLRPSSLSSATSTSKNFPLPSASTSTSTPLFNRRLNIGMTPRTKPYHLANNSTTSSSKTKRGSFVTPFKGGKRPEGLTPMGLVREKVEMAKTMNATGNGGGGATPQTTTTKTTMVGMSSRKKEGRKGNEKGKVFDLDHEQPRFDLFTYGMRPQTHLYEELELQGFSEEILSMTSTSSKSYIFPCNRSVQDAFSSLKSLVSTRCPGDESLVTLPWVTNHWELIVWKLACYVRTRPDLYEKWWKFEFVMDQLRYRYEREINQAERSSIKRIQERDSSASLPLVLCVSQLLWEDPDESTSYDDDGATQVIVGVELTDGWYRIRAEIDQTLKSACERGKLIVGSKLAITGARLNKFRQEGIDVLEALGRSKLVISGNSTSLAPWHTTLGFSRTQFIASLDSLSSSGGVVAPLDIIIEKIFELGYVDTLRTNSGTWGEAEEREKAQEWEKGRERIRAKMEEAAEKEGTEEDDLVAFLQEAVAGACEDGIPSHSESDPDVDMEDPEEIIERLETTSGNKRAIVRKVSPRCLQACLEFATERAQRSRRQAYDELKQDLDQKYPPRQTRSVRMMRIRDARQGSNGPFEREAILTVWDVKDYASDFFREGKRYLVTNTIVKGNWQRNHKEITLHTKKDSKWTKL
ncbi:uncharacterized protein JCM6883_006377 [Sporobolomyces salmoneus]|uniref:uncharacterized protein n=1 Tax=Sporobolomyces salmoneus TaxID=183962 RepID=UPI003176FB9B